MSTISPVILKLLDVINPLNESRHSETLLKVDYSVDHDKYYWPIYFHNLQVICSVLFSVVAVDSFFVMAVHSAISMFNVLG